MPLGRSMTLAELLERLLVHADLRQVERDDRAIEHPHDHALAEHRRQHADAQVDRVATDGELDPAVLRQPALGDVEVRHDLDAGGDGEGQVARRRDHFVEHAVGLDADAELVFERLEVQVAGVLLDRHQEHHVEQLAHRCAVGQRRDVVEIDRAVGADAGGGGGQLGVFFQRRNDALDALGALAVVAFELRGHRRLGRHDDADVVAQERPQLVLHAQVLRVAGGDRERVAVELDRHDAIHLRHRRRDHRQHVVLDLDVGQRHRVQRQLLGQRLGELIVVDQTHVDGDFAEQLARMLVLLIHQQLLLLVGDEAHVHQDLSDASMCHVEEFGVRSRESGDRITLSYAAFSPSAFGWSSKMPFSACANRLRRVLPRCCTSPGRLPW